jgi:hypothetical protein
VSDGAAVVLDKSSKVASGLDQIDAEAEDVRLDGEGEAKIGRSLVTCRAIWYKVQ